jgi:hypothetical protein
MIYYEVWGRDTFAGETFLIGRYKSQRAGITYLQKE